MIYPYLNYCNIIWASNYPSRLKRLTILQNRAVRFIIGYPPLCRVDFAYKQLGLLKLKLITLYQISEFMFKYSRNQLPPVFNKYFVLSTDANPYRLRSSSSSSYRPIYTRTNTRMFTIRYSGAKLWNDIPEKLKVIQNLYSFKASVREHFLLSSFEYN